MRLYLHTHILSHITAATTSSVVDCSMSAHVHHRLVRFGARTRGSLWEPAPAPAAVNVPSVFLGPAIDSQKSAQFQQSVPVSLLLSLTVADQFTRCMLASVRSSEDERKSPPDRLSTARRCGGFLHEICGNSSRIQQYIRSVGGLPLQLTVTYMYRRLTRRAHSVIADDLYFQLEPSVRRAHNLRRRSEEMPERHLLLIPQLKEISLTLTDRRYCSTLPVGWNVLVRHLEHWLANEYRDL